MTSKSKNNPPEATEAPSEHIFSDFLENVPPSSVRTVTDARYYQDSAWILRRPDIQLHCGSDHCGGLRFFAATGQPPLFGAQTIEVFLTYVCRNCRSSHKVFALGLSVNGAGNKADALKIGEWPVFGPPTPPRVIAMVGPDRDAYLKGRRAENQGMGVGAYAYYRRVVETQKSRLIDEVLRVAEKTGASATQIEALKKAKEETQFSRAMDLVKDAVPASLLINGHNPLTLLHSALSDGLHSRTDEECLELAGSIRVVLQEMAEKASLALKDTAELTSAVSRLLNRK